MTYKIERMEKTKTKLIGYVGVDAGMLMITDPCYLNGWKDTEYDTGEIGEYSYGGVCRTTDDPNLQGGQLKYELGHDGIGVVFRSGLGDGYYPVYGHYAEVDGWGERIVKVEIVFVEEE
jgi:hypothetical protein